MSKFVCLSKECVAGAAGGPLVVDAKSFPPPGWALVKVSIDFGAPKGLVAIIQGILCPQCAQRLTFLNAHSNYVPPPKVERDANEAPENETAAVGASPANESMTIGAGDIAEVPTAALTGEKA